MTVAPFAMTGFFFLYVGSITMAVYVLLRILFSHTDGIKVCLVKIARMLVAYLMGLALGAFIFIPEIVGLFQSNRVNDGRWVRWFYSIHEYKEMFYQLFMAQEANFQVLAIPTIGILSVAVLVLAERRWKEKFVILAGGAAFICPAVSLAMCGFVSTYDRWEVVLVLLVAVLVLCAWDELLHINKFELLGIFNLYLLFLVAGHYDDMFEDGYYQLTVKIFTCLLLVLFVVFWTWKKLGSERILRYLLFVVSVITICIGWKNNVRYRDVSQVQEQNVLAEMDLEQDEFYRIESERTFGEDRTAQNYSMLYDYYD